MTTANKLLRIVGFFVAEIISDTKYWCTTTHISQAAVKVAGTRSSSDKKPIVCVSAISFSGETVFSSVPNPCKDMASRLMINNLVTNSFIKPTINFAHRVCNDHIMFCKAPRFSRKVYR